MYSIFYNLINCYLMLLIPLASISFAIFALGVFFIFKWQHSVAINLPVTESPSISLTDLNAIAGEELTDTQLDLARALVESGKKSIALPMLQSIQNSKNKKVKQEAEKILSLIKN